MTIYLPDTLLDAVARRTQAAMASHTDAPLSERQVRDGLCLYLPVMVESIVNDMDEWAGCPTPLLPDALIDAYQRVA